MYLSKLNDGKLLLLSVFCIIPSQQKSRYLCFPIEKMRTSNVCPDIVFFSILKFCKYIEFVGYLDSKSARTVCFQEVDNRGADYRAHSGVASPTIVCQQGFINSCASSKDHPGRTFLGKRRYFSGIAALTPLTPLTYKQNAVNAFIPTKKNAVNAIIPTSKTPLTPLYQQKNAVKAAIFPVKRR